MNDPNNSNHQIYGPETSYNTPFNNFQPPPTGNNIFTGGDQYPP
jgi:hypothetical protein